MIELIPGLPDGVVGLRGSGDITADDYEHVVIPAIDGALASNDKIRLFYVLGPEVDDFEAEAAWEDTKVGMEHLFRFERMALVTDIDWIRRSIKAVGFVIPAKVKVFGTDEEDQARAWVSTSD